MNHQQLETTLGETIIDRDTWEEGKHGQYHPSQVSGCPLKVHLNKMVDLDFEYNCWLFQGSAVHYYLQETGILSEALHKIGYHELDTYYEERTLTHIEDEIYLTGQADVICHSEDGHRTIFDIKYSSVKPGSQNNRLISYLSQANTYAFMFDADQFGLILIDNRADHIPDGITVIDNERSEENWELVKRKARAIHEALETAGYEDGVVWTQEELNGIGKEFWEEVMEHFDTDDVPAYEEECNYCEHSPYCPVYNGTLGGVNQFRGGA